MKILHYIFGLPPLRGGGAIKYTLDLAEEQRNFGHDVSLIYPGEIRNTVRKIKIIRRKGMGSCNVYEILNPLPVSFVAGISEPEKFMQPGDQGVFDAFFEKEGVDILHIHSLMGMHKELLIAAKQHGVTTFLTTHDYFGICPRTFLFQNGGICSEISWENCEICCSGTERTSLLIFRQSHFFQWAIRCKWLVGIKRRVTGLLSKHINKRPGKQQREANVRKKKALYESLRQYYLDELGLMDIVLYNSSVAKENYEKRFVPEKSMILGGMHKGIQDRRKSRKYGFPLRLAYLGNQDDYKGYRSLISALDKLERTDSGAFTLTVFMARQDYERRYLISKRPFTYRQLDEIYEDIDVVIVPSLWAETFGFVALEAISYAVPVILTENVGACDLLHQYNGIGFVSKAGSEGLQAVLREILHDRSLLEQANRRICKTDICFDYEKYVQYILRLYRNEVEACRR